MNYELREKVLQEATWLEYSMSERVEYSNDRLRLKELAKLLKHIIEEENNYEKN